MANKHFITTVKKNEVILQGFKDSHGKLIKPSFLVKTSLHNFGISKITSYGYVVRNGLLF